MDSMTRRFTRTSAAGLLLACLAFPASGGAVAAIAGGADAARAAGPAGTGSATPGGAPGSAPALDWNLSAAQISANCAARLADAKAAAKRILTTHRATFGGVVLPLEDINADLNDRLVSETILASVSSDRAVRDASLGCQNDVNDFSTALQAEPALYAEVAAAVKHGDAKTLADRKLAALWLTALQRSGAGLPAAQRREFVALGQRLNAAQNSFGANLANDKTVIELTATEIAGLPADLVATFARNGERYVVPVGESTAGRFYENASDPEARKAYYLAYNNRAYPANVTLLQEAIAVRDRSAHLLGYPNWAAFVLADRMAANPQRVETFLGDLDRKLLPAARTTLARLAALKAKDSGLPGVAINPWDVTYYNNQLMKTTYAVDSDRIRRYFPVEHVERAVFDIYSKLLGVRFTQRVPGNVWSPDVTEWAVSNAADGRYLGDFYLDLFPRPGKYTHFANFPLLPARRLPDGSLRPPLSAIIGNWPKPAPGAPALLSHDDVETFFHEFGHNMAALLATAPYETLSAGFRTDFVEAPSQMLENWVWDPQILKLLSAKVDTGEPLPDDLIAKMRAARSADATSSFNPYAATRQIMLAQIDMAYHTSGAKVDTTAVWARIAAADTPLPLAPGVHPQATFGHLMGGYDAGYYGYLWSLVYAQDMFTAFQAGGLESPRVGARYRKYILEPAREIEPDQEVRAFLGRPMSPNAFYSALGINASPSK
jgi:thimet oligopeptidase